MNINRWEKTDDLQRHGGPANSFLQKKVHTYFWGMPVLIISNSYLNI